MAAALPHLPSLTRSASIAGWLTVHVLVGCWLLSVVVGDCAPGLGAGESPTWVLADAAQVMALIKVPMHPIVALGLFFAALTALLHAVSTLWHRLLCTLAADDLEALTTSAWRWSLKRQLLSAWLLAPVALCGGALLSLHLGRGAMVLMLFLFCLLVLPALVLRPRWLDAAGADKAWCPRAASMGAFAAAVVISVSVGAASTLWGGPLIQTLSFVLTVWLSWLAAGALIAVRSRQELVPYLRSTLHRRFTYGVVVASVKPLRAFMIWLLPPLILISYYAIFVAPVVKSISPYLPAYWLAVDALVTQVGGLSVSYWWVFSIPAASTFANLYMGRCRVLFDRQMGANENPDVAPDAP
jgi:hypothetical protein